MSPILLLVSVLSRALRPAVRIADWAEERLEEDKQRRWTARVPPIGALVRIIPGTCNCTRDALSKHSGLWRVMSHCYENDDVRLESVGSGNLLAYIHTSALKEQNQ